MYTITLLPGDYLWTHQATHECDEKGFVKISSCLGKITVESQVDYLRVQTILFDERLRKGLINIQSSSNLWLLNRPTEFGYQIGSFIVPSSIPNTYQLKKDLEKCCSHVGILADTVCFDPIEYVPTKTPRTKVIKTKEPLIHGYSNEKVEEYATWDETKQDYVIKREITYSWNTSNVTKEVPFVFVTEANETITTTRAVPIMIEQEVVEYEYDPLEPSRVLYDIDYERLQPKYPIKYLSSDGSEISKEAFDVDPSQCYIAMYVPFVKLSCECSSS